VHELAGDNDFITPTRFKSARSWRRMARRGETQREQTQPDRIMAQSPIHCRILALEPNAVKRNERRFLSFTGFGLRLFFPALPGAT
jgi:hypothetical protein